MKEKLFKKGITRRLFSVVLALTMVLGLMPMGAYRVHAEDSTNWSTEVVSISFFGDYYFDTDIISFDGTNYNCSDHGRVALVSGDNVYATTAFEFYCSKSTHWKVAHTHNWEYTLPETNTIKAVCKGTGDCTVSGGKDTGVSLTLTASNATYSGSPVTVCTDGSNPEATIKYNLTDWTGAGLSAPTVEYNVDDTWGTTAPIAAGTYQVRMYPAGETQSDDNTAVTEFTINNAKIDSVAFEEPTASAGSTPAVAEDIEIPEDANYYVADISWSPEIVEKEEQEGCFDYATEYTATITLEAKNNWEFAEDVELPEGWTKDEENSTAGCLVLTKTYEKTEKDKPEYTEPEDLTANCGDKLSDVELPEGFTWTSDGETVLEAGETEEGQSVTYFAKFTPENTDYYEEVENIEISIAVTHGEKFEQIEGTETHKKVCGKCDFQYDAEPEACTGGTATCKEKAVCEKCESEYGEVNNKNHEGDTEFKNEKPATLTENGQMADKYCKSCGTLLRAGKEIVAPKEIVLGKETRVYNGNALTTTVEVTDVNGNVIPATEYTVSYKNNTNPGTATVTVKFKNARKYDCTLTKTFKITVPKMGMPTAQVDGIGKINVAWKQMAGASGYTVRYVTGENDEIVSTRTVEGGDVTSRVLSGLKEGETYKISVRAYFTKGSYTTYGEWSNQREIEIPISAKTVTLAKTAVTYNGKARTVAVEVKGADNKVIDSKYYTVSYKNNTLPGTAKVVVTFNGGVYAGTLTETFKINLPGMNTPTVTALSASKVKVTWKAKENISGYTVKYTYKDASGKEVSQTRTVNGAVSNAKELIGLVKGTEYAVSVRTFLTVDGKTYYGAWSEATTVTTK